MKCFVLIAALLGLPLLPQGLSAQGLPDNLVRAEILPGWQTGAGTRMAALRLVLAPGWKTYWRSPGEAGIPPSFDWSSSSNLGSVALHWPRPQVFDLSGFRTLAYPDELVLPIEVTGSDPGQPVHLAVTVDLGVCEEICVPATIQVSADLAGAGARDPAISAALASAPRDGAALGLPAAQCRAEPIRDGMRLTATLPVRASGPADFAAVELADRSVWVSLGETRAAGETTVQVADLVPGSARPFALNRADVRLTLFSGDDVIEFNGCRG